MSPHIPGGHAACPLGEDVLAAGPKWGPDFDPGREEGTHHHDERWRELFPLPTSEPTAHLSGLSTSQRRRRAKVRQRVHEVNEISGCLNEMYSSTHLGQIHQPTLAQRQSHHTIFQQLGRTNLPKQRCNEREAIQELLHSHVSYDGGTTSSTVRPYDRDLISLPQVGAKLVSLPEVLDPIGREVVEGAAERMMLDEDAWGRISEEQSGFRPYMDKVLANDKQKYNQFIVDLFDKNMVDFTAKPKDLISPFFVKKKNGKLRLVLDCRGVNRRFLPPPPMALSAGSTWSQVQIGKDEKLFVAQSDVKDYFYSLELPAAIRDFFCMPAVPSSLLQERGLAADRCSDGDGWCFPRLRAVPMGWSWAMWISQRVHQFLALQACGLSPDRLLVEGRPCPDLSDGSPALIVYADNLNVLGTNEMKVQEVKDVIVQKLRSVNFIVHEELDAVSIAQSLGFLIDGEKGIISPIPERLDKVLAAFRWLARRPKISGQALERLMGHTIHLCLLRRELLSVFRALYDFMYSSYFRRQRLWASAAKEAKWCSCLLKLCTVDIRRPRSETITASDASLSGIAVCQRSLSEDLQRRGASLKETWRYKSCVPCKPRESALSGSDPFSDPNTVKPLSTSKETYDPYELNLDFEEIDKSILNPEDWTECFAVHMQYSEHITLLEGRGVVAALRHKFRSATEFGRSHLHLNDNMAIALLMSKGRSGHYSMLRICRRVACLLLATDSSLAVRWVPSESNIADKPSRKWEALRKQDAFGRTKTRQREEILERCYPTSGNKYGSRDWLCHADPFARQGSGATDCQEKEKSGSSVSRLHGEQKEVPSTDSEREIRSSSVSRANSIGEACSIPSSSHRLLEEDPGVETVCNKVENQIDSEIQIRHGLLQVCQQHVRTRLRLPGWNKDAGGNHRQLSRLRPSAHVVPNKTGFARVAKGGPTTDSSTSAMASDCFDGVGSFAYEAKDSGSGNLVDVHSIPSPRRSAGPAQGRLDSTYARQSSLLTPPASCKARCAVQGGAVRRISHAGLSNFAVAGTSATEAGNPSNLSPGHLLRPPGKILEACAHQDRTGAVSRGPLPTATLRTQLRSSTAATVPIGGEATRSLGLRSQCQKVRGSCPHSPRVSCFAQEDPRQLHPSREDFSTGGPKTFQPVEPMSGQAKRFVVEIFSGCARLSRCCSQQGFVCIAYDLEYGNNNDLLNQRVYDSLVRFIRKLSHEIALVWFGTPCTTWSRARKLDGGPRPLRDDGEGLMGLSGLSPSEQTKVDEGNSLLSITADLVDLCFELQLRWVIENPLTSRIWLTPRLVSFVERGAQFFQTDFCAFGMPWRKSTGFLVFRWNNFQKISQLCTPEHGRCSFSQRKHIILTGKDSTGQWMTRRAQPYPLRMCHQLAVLLKDDM